LRTRKYGSALSACSVAAFELSGTVKSPLQTYT
jgi:hypothetical protein